LSSKKERKQKRGGVGYLPVGFVRLWAAVGVLADLVPIFLVSVVSFIIGFAVVGFAIGLWVPVLESFPGAAGSDGWECRGGCLGPLALGRGNGGAFLLKKALRPLKGGVRREGGSKFMVIT
jgi:hypothetical protein